jgi:uncharacterized membrane protein YgaE (UPF0421/DUF939 family)
MSKKIENLNKKIENYNKTINKYKKEKEIIVVCPYCGAYTNMWNLNHHLKTKNCLKIKDILLKNKPNIENDFILKLNEIKKDIKYNKNINHERTIEIIDDNITEYILNDLEKTN